MSEGNVLITQVVVVNIIIIIIMMSVNLMHIAFICYRLSHSINIDKNNNYYG